jgi:hypothetical protein
MKTMSLSGGGTVSRQSNIVTCTPPAEAGRAAGAMTIRFTTTRLAKSAFEQARASRMDASAFVSRFGGVK